MKNTIGLTIGACLALSATTAFAGGLDRSNQDITGLFQDGSVIGLSLNYVMPNISGTIYGSEADDVAPAYYGLGLVTKTDIGDNFSIAMIYDQPFGADIKYDDNLDPTIFNHPLYGPVPIPNPAAGAEAKVSSNAFTIAGQFKINPQISVYAGPRVVVVEGKYSAPNIPQLGGLAYDLDAGTSTGAGYIVGAAYEKPEIALRFAVTYSSAIELEFDAAETIGSNPAQKHKLEVTLPQSVNVDFQTGINERTLLFAGMRWANWEEFEIAPTIYSSVVGDSIAAYEDDPLSYKVGLGYKIDDQWSVAGQIGYEPSTDNEFSPLSPTNGSTTLGAAVSYNGGSYTVRGGLSYAMLGDADGVNAALGAEHDFSGNSAIGFGISVSQSF